MEERVPNDEQSDARTEWEFWGTTDEEQQQRHDENVVMAWFLPFVAVPVFVVRTLRDFRDSLRERRDG